MINKVCTVAAMAVLVALQPSAASATDFSAPSDQKGTQAKPDKVKEKMICHRETPTGSVRPVRICKTQAEADADAARAQQQLDNMNEMRRTG